MRVILLLCLTVFLFNGCFGVDMDTMNVEQMVEMVDADPTKLTEATEMFVNKFSKEYTFTLMERNMGKSSNFYVHEFTKRIEFHTLELMEKVLKHFGHVIPMLMINNSFLSEGDLTNMKQLEQNTMKQREISRLVNKYCSETLTKLSIVSSRKVAVSEFTMPFKEVEDLRIEINARRDSENGLPLNKLFPKLRRLSLSFEQSDLDYSFIDCRLPHLEHFKRKHFPLTPKTIGFLEKNPQIRSYESTVGYQDFGKIYKYLPNIENLMIENGSDDIQELDNIRLERVKNFVLRTGWNSHLFMEKMELPSLESFSTMYYSPMADKWIDFARRHPKIKRFHLANGDDDVNRSYEQLLAFTELLPDLVKITMERFTYVNVDTIIKMMESHKQLTEIEFAIKDFQESDKVILQQKFGKEWNFETMNGGLIPSTFLLKKKE